MGGEIHPESRKSRWSPSSDSDAVSSIAHCRAACRWFLSPRRSARPGAARVVSRLDPDRIRDRATVPGCHQALTWADIFDMASARAFTAAESCLRSDLVTVE